MPRWSTKGKTVLGMGYSWNSVKEIFTKIFSRERDANPMRTKGDRAIEALFGLFSNKGIQKKTLFFCFQYSFSMHLFYIFCGHHSPLFFLFLNLLSVMEGKVERASSEKRWTFKRICVFCGSKPGSKSIFSDATVALGQQLVIITQKKKKKKTLICTKEIQAFSIYY